MKTGVMIGMIVAAILAGGAGGFAVTEYLSMQDEDAPKEITADTSDETGNDYDTQAALAERDRRINELNKRIDILEGDVDKIEPADNSDLLAKIDSLTKKVEGFESGAVVAKGDGTTVDEEGNVVAGEEDVITKAVQAELERREEQERQEREKQREEWMKQRMESEKERVITAMTEKLSLTPLQQENVKTVLSDYQAKRTEFWAKSMEARRNGEEFDYQAKRDELETATKNAIEAELTLSQISSFQELLGDDEIDDIGEEEGGGRWGRRGR